jgi:exodeoxyribonuclease-3
MKIATYNVNSIRKRLPIVLAWLDRHHPDIVCLQETKVRDDEFPLLDLRAAGYHVTFRGRTGFNGVATLSLREPEVVMHGFFEGVDEEDDRVLLTVIGGLPVVNTYVPQGRKVGSDTYAFKLAWFGRLRRFFEGRLDPDKPAVWLGDLNVAPEPIDVYHPDRRGNDADFHIDARNAYKEAASWGFIDVFRKLHPERVQYTYWDYFRNALANNYGWRIDHIMATAPLAARCMQADVDMIPRQAESASDHTVMWAEFSDQ